MDVLDVDAVHDVDDRGHANDLHGHDEGHGHDHVDVHDDHDGEGRVECGVCVGVVGLHLCWVARTHLSRK